MGGAILGSGTCVRTKRRPGEDRRENKEKGTRGEGRRQPRGNGRAVTSGQDSPTMRNHFANFLFQWFRPGLIFESRKAWLWR